MSKTISGIVTWLKQWFYTKDEIYDTGWQSFPLRTGRAFYMYIENYDHVSMNNWSSSMTGENLLYDYPDQPLRIRRIGKIVHIEGAITSDGTGYKSSSDVFPLKELCMGEHNATTYNGDLFFTIGTLSEEFRPSDRLITIQQGSGINRYFVGVYPDGSVKIGRYGVDSYVNPQKHPWLNINITYMVD